MRILDFFKIYVQIFLGLVVFAGSEKLRAQSVEQGVFKYDIENGLPSLEIYDSYQDHLGYIWFSSDHGIIRYNGNDFTTIPLENWNTNYNTCFRILPYGKRLFTNSIDGSIYEILQNKLILVFKNNDKLRQRNKRGWFDILHFDAHLNEMHLIPTAEMNPIKIDIHGVDKIKKMPKIIGDTLKLFEGNIGTLVRHKLNPSDRYFSESGIWFNKKSQSDYWVINLSQTKNILVFKKNELIHQFFLPSSLHINNMYIRDNQILICTSEGIKKYSFDGQYLESSFEKYNISSILFDYEQNMWLTTLNSGILRVSTEKIRNILIPNLINNSIKFVSLKIINQYCIATTYNNYYYLFDIRSGIILDTLKINESRNPFDIAQLGDTLYSFSNKIFIYNKKLIVNHIPGIKDFGNKALSLENGKTITALSLGYEIYNAHHTKVQYSHPNFNKILCFAPLSKDEVIAGTVKGLYKINTLNPDKRIQLKLKGVDSFVRVNDIKRINNIYILATTGAGVIITDLNRVVNLSVNNGLPIATAHSLAIDEYGHIWIASNSGISCLLFDSQKPFQSEIQFRNFSKNRGLSGNFVSAITYGKGQLWVATNRGISYFNSNISNHSSIKPRTIIEYYQSTDLKKQVSVYNKNGVIKINYNENNFFIHFISVYSDKPYSTSFYRYRFINSKSDTNWSYTSQNEIQFTNLNPGIYIFEVAARNNNQEWGESAQLHITITPHFTQTLWFKSIIFILILGLIAGVIFIIYRRQQKIQQEKLQLQEARIRTREADLNTLRNQMNPHFVFNALNSIQGLIYNKDFKSANEYLVRFSQLMRDTLQISKTQAITIENEVQYLNNYLQIESSRFEYLFTYEIIVAEELEIEDRGIPSMLVQPIVENAVKHAFKEHVEQGLISIRFETHSDENYLNVIIADNGIGIENAKQRTQENKNRKSLGMQIVNERISLLQDKGFTLSKISVQEEKKSGMNTVIVLTLPLLNIE